MKTNIYRNAVITGFNEKNEVYRERILWINPTNDIAITIDIDNKKAFPVCRNLADIQNAMGNTDITITQDPYESLSIPNSKPLKEYKKVRKDWWDIIKLLVHNEPAIYDETQRGKLIEEASRTHKVHKKDIYKYVKRYWVGGQTKNAILVTYNKCGGSGKSRVSSKGFPITEKIKDIFRAGTNLYYNKKIKMPLKMVFTKIKIKFFNLNKGVDSDLNPKFPDKLPTLHQFQYWFRENNNPVKTYIARHGQKKFNLNIRGLGGDTAKMAIGPGSLYQIDATIGDIHLKSSLEPSKNIGRPVIYFVVDVFSRAIVGFYIGLEGPSWIGAMMALANAVMDKVEFCKRYGIEISHEDWPCKGLPEQIIGDRGEMESNTADNLADGLNILMSNTPPYRADLKAFVEQQFRLFNLQILHWLPGAVRAKITERGEKDPSHDAVLNITELTQMTINAILYYNKNRYIENYPFDKTMIEENVKYAPLDLWAWGIDKNGCLREKSPEVIYFNLMPSTKAVVTPEGIRANKSFYWCERMISEQWREIARLQGRWEVTAHYDPRKTDTIYIQLPDSNIIEKCYLMAKEEEKKDYCLEELEEAQKTINSQPKELETGNLGALAVLEAKNNKILQAAIERNKDNKKTSIIKDVDLNRSEEKEALRQEEAWNLFPDDPHTISESKNTSELDEEEEFAKEKENSMYLKR